MVLDVSDMPWHYDPICHIVEKLVEWAKNDFEDTIGIMVQYEEGSFGTQTKMTNLVDCTWYIHQIIVET